MHKFTKIFLAVVAVIVAVSAGFYALESYAFNHPRIAITFYTSGEGSENVYTIPQLSLEPRGLTGVSEEWDNRYFEIMGVIDSMLEIARAHTGDAPYFYDSEVKVEGDKTVFTISGYYTKDGERVEESQSFTLDYVVTEDIAEH